MYKHLCLCPKGKIIGVSYLNTVFENESSIYIGDKALPWEGNNFRGWSYIGEEFIPPAEPTETDALNKELKTVTAELRKIFNEEQFSAFLGATQVAAMAMSLNTTSAMSRKDELLARRAEIIARLAEIA